MFDRDIKVVGKHANFLKDLCELAGNVPDRDEHANFKIFNAYIDAYILCPLIGYQYGRKGSVDNITEAKQAGIMAEAILKRRNELKFVYQIIMLVDEESEPDVEKRIYRATTFSENTDEERKFISENMKIHEAYFLGGLEVLHEQFVDKCIDEEDYQTQIFTFVKQFYEEQDGNMLKESINKFFN